MTGREKLNNMNDEQLYKLIRKVNSSLIPCPVNLTSKKVNDGCGKMSCKKCWLEALENEIGK